MIKYYGNKQSTYIMFVDWSNRKFWFSDGPDITPLAEDQTEKRIMRLGWKRISKKEAFLHCI